jgi:3-deoxy-7-phosphoheptulonate synthase
MLPSPDELKEELPNNSLFIPNARNQAAELLERKNRRLVSIVGPCSIHDPEAALEYATRIKHLAPSLPSLFLVMRLFFEKPRTGLGWKGMLYDPHLDGSCDVKKGLKETRELLLALARLEIPVATELLDPLAAPYYQDLITWGFIGARTAASQPHRQLASSFSFPVGFKNSIFGELGPAIQGILNARAPHIFLGIDGNGRVARHQSQGNPLTHLVLRGSESDTNFDLASVQEALSLLIQHELEPHLLIDCSHGNSGKDHSRQGAVFGKVLEHIQEGVEGICGLMLESHLHAGKQPHSKNPSYGLSITDSCIGWEETEDLLCLADETLSSTLPTSIHSVQK